MTYLTMAVVRRQSCEGVKSELDLFGVPPIQTSIDAGQWVEHQPETSLDSGGPIELLLPVSGDAYPDREMPTWIGRCLPESVQHLPVGASEGDQR